jgi:hypothetical protein
LQENLGKAGRRSHLVSINRTEEYSSQATPLNSALAFGGSIDFVQLNYLHE